MHQLACRGMEIKKTLYIVSVQNVLWGRMNHNGSLRLSHGCRPGRLLGPVKLKLCVCLSTICTLHSPSLCYHEEPAWFPRGLGQPGSGFSIHNPHLMKKIKMMKCPSWGAILTPNSRRSSNGRQPIQLPPPKMTFKLMMMPTPHLASNSRRRI